MRRSALVVGLLALVAVGGSAVVKPAATGETQDFVVLYRTGTTTAAVHRAITESSGTLLRENLAVGVATVRSSNPRFLTEISAESSVEGAARSVPIGNARPAKRPKPNDVEQSEGERHAARPTPDAVPEAPRFQSRRAPSHWPGGSGTWR